MASLSSLLNSDSNSIYKPDQWNVNTFQVILEEVADISILLIETSHKMSLISCSYRKPLQLVDSFVR